VTFASHRESRYDFGANHCLIRAYCSYQAVKCSFWSNQNKKLKIKNAIILSDHFMSEPSGKRAQEIQIKLIMVKNRAG